MSDRWSGFVLLFVFGCVFVLVVFFVVVFVFLRDPDEDARLRMAERARSRILAEHTAAHRAEQLEAYALELIDAVEAAP